MEDRDEIREKLNELMNNSKSEGKLLEKKRILVGLGKLVKDSRVRVEDAQIFFNLVSAEE